MKCSTVASVFLAAVLSIVGCNCYADIVILPNWSYDGPYTSLVGYGSYSVSSSVLPSPYLSASAESITSACNAAQITCSASAYIGLTYYMEVTGTGSTALVDVHAYGYATGYGGQASLSFPGLSGTFVASDTSMTPFLLT
jgi:hypothetical protein